MRAKLLNCWIIATLRRKSAARWVLRAPVCWCSKAIDSRRFPENGRTARPARAWPPGAITRAPRATATPLHHAGFATLRRAFRPLKGGIDEIPTAAFTRQFYFLSGKSDAHKKTRSQSGCGVNVSRDDRPSSSCRPSAPRPEYRPAKPRNPTIRTAPRLPFPRQSRAP